MASGDGCVTKRVEVTKSPEDKREYRGLVLSNGVRAVVVSDATTDESAAAAAVHVGSLKDPREWQGLAHFCEHMLFLGTETHPEEDGYAKYISEHGGSNNAYTADDHTCYYFGIAPPHLGEALHRFSRFFVCPLFTESATEREVQAVNSEHSKNIPNDNWRLNQLEHTLANAEHDYQKFFTGSLQTLLPKPELAAELRQQLLSFHAANYSANRLSVALLGKESLDELETMLATAFGDVIDKQLPDNKWSTHPFEDGGGARQLGVRVSVAPNKDLRILSIVFPMPDYSHLYRSSPEDYVSHLIGHESPGSVLAYLKQRGWSNSLSAGGGGSGNGFDFFRVRVDLTEEGLQCVDRVAAAIFEYIAMLRREGPKQWIFEEERDLQAMAFRFGDKPKPGALCLRLAPKLLRFDMQDALTARQLLHDFRPDVVSDILERLRPDNCKLFVAAKSLEAGCDQTEEHYGVKYGVQPMTDDELQRLAADCEAADRLRLPAPNPFIAKDYRLRDRLPPAAGPEAGDSEAEKPQPTVIGDSTGCRLWFRQDDEYLLPKCCYTFKLSSPIANCEPLAVVSANLYLLLVEDALNSLTYDAELAGLGYGLTPTAEGASISLSGYNDKLPVLLDKVAERIREPNIDPVRFRSVFDSYKRSLENFKLEQPYSHCMFNRQLICRDVLWTHAEKLEALADVTLQSVLEFGQRLLSRLHVEALIFGNATPDEAESVAQSLLDRLACHRLPQSQLRRLREIVLPAGSCHARVVTVPLHQSSACAVFYQLQPCHSLAEKLRQQVLVKLLAQVLQERFFDQLRTKEQLGYIVASQDLPNTIIESFVLLVQSERHPVYLESRIDNFLEQKAPQLLESMTDAEFADHVSSLDNIITQKPKQLRSRNRRFVDEIGAGTYCFDRADRLSDILRNHVTKQDLVLFFETSITKSSPQCRRLSVHAVSEATFGSARPEDYADYKTPVIDDVAEFKRHLPLGPLPPSALSDQQRQRQRLVEEEAASCTAKL